MANNTKDNKPAIIHYSIVPGDKVKITVRFRGREVNHSQIGESLLEKFAEATSEVANVEKKAKLEGRNMIMFIAPVKQTAAK